MELPGETHLCTSASYPSTWKSESLLSKSSSASWLARAPLANCGREREPGCLPRGTCALGPTVSAALGAAVSSTLRPDCVLLRLAPQLQLALCCGHGGPRRQAHLCHRREECSE